MFHVNFNNQNCILMFYFIYILVNLYLRNLTYMSNYKWTEESLKLETRKNNYFNYLIKRPEIKKMNT